MLRFLNLLEDQASKVLRRGVLYPGGSLGLGPRCPVLETSPSNLTLHKPLRMLAYSSEKCIESFECMDFMPACGTLKAFYVVPQTFFM